MQDRHDAVFRKQIVDECEEVGNISLVCRRHGLARGTVGRWIRRQRATGTQKGLPKDTRNMMAEISQEMRHVSNENAVLRRLVADKDVENAILKELLEKANPR
ncbi:MAG: transposase [Clostridia bacterium]|nr:transposase [Clostridia bacterium]